MDPRRFLTRRSHAIALAGALLLAVALLTGCAIGRGFEAVKLLTDIAASQGASEPDGNGVVRRAVAQGGLTGDLYLPARPGDGADEPLAAGAALVLVPGLAEAGKDDARIVGLAGALARAHIAVLVPDIASLRELRAGPENVREIAAALAFLAGEGRALWRRPEDPDDMSKAPVGVAAVSYAVGPALLATLEPEVAGRTAFLIGIGGYHDITAALTFATTGWHRDATGNWREGRPNIYGKWAFVLANVARVTDPRDRTSLEAMARRRLSDPAAPIDDLAAGLGPEGRAIHDFVTNTDPDRVPELMSALPQAIHADMMALDLAGRDLSQAPPHVLLVHGRDDPIIPASESMALHDALGPERAELILLESLAHADLGLQSLRDAYRLWRATRWLLVLRDGAL